MDFSLSEEQTMLADSVTRFIDNDYDFESRMRVAESDAAFDPAHWQTFAELGWTAMLFAEEDGGFDGGPVELMLIMQQIGRGLVVEPFLANVVLAGGVLKRLAPSDQKAAMLGSLIDGSQQFALAFAEPQSHFDLHRIDTVARPDDGHFVLNGQKSLVLNGGNADTLIIRHAPRTGGRMTAHHNRASACLRFPRIPKA